MSVARITLAGVQIEGNLLAADITAELLAGNVKGQAPEDFGFTKTDKLADEIAIAWGDAKAYWAAFQRQLDRLDADDTATSVTRELWVVPLLRSLGYNPVYTAKAEVVEGQTYAISHRAELGENKPPIHIIGCRIKVDHRPPSGTPRLSAHALVQEYLNKTEHLWAIATNGYRWRLLRDSSLMTRLTYIEFDLEQILNGENFAEFALFYRLFHRSRLPEGMDDADKCLLEYYHQEALQQGGRVRDRLRDGVEKALIQLGTGFLQHPSNENLRQKLAAGTELTDIGYYRQLLRLIYRLLFLMVAESRNLLIGDDVEKARIYREYYSIERLRELAERPHWRREGFQDLWQGLRVTFLLFDENWRGKYLGLSPLNGDLFGSSTLPALDDCAIDNHDLLVAIRELSLYQDKGQLRRVNYAALDVEELGSVYESLLDFHPEISPKNQELKLVFGSERKTTGSYYTPPQLVGQLIKTALEPVIEEKLRSTKEKLRNAESNYELEKALLDLKIVDPACGSGHFLLAAARRVGKELAKIRTGEAEPGSEPLKLAIRDVIQNCIYGVDLNPLAVDLCKVALWIEGFSRGLPLNFLDHRIKCGNSLVGVMDLSCLNEGIPDEAFKPVTGDDKVLANRCKKENKKQRETDLQGQLSIFNNLEQQRTEYVASFRELGAIPETSPQQVRDKQAQYQQSRKNPGWWQDYSACNLWTTVFFMQLTEDNLQLLPTTAALSQLLKGNVSTQNIVDAANNLAEKRHFFHWGLEFSEVFEQGGFDCVLGNPPWELLQIEEQKFFAARDIRIAKLSGYERKKAIQNLSKNKDNLFNEFENAKYFNEAQNKFIRECGRFVLTTEGKLNTYSVFCELAIKLISTNGRVGIIVPTSIATDESNKYFIQNLIKNSALVSFFDFTNRGYIFYGTESTFPFSLLTLKHNNTYKISLSSQLWKIEHLNDKSRVYNLRPEDIKKLNPNTLNLPIIKSAYDARLILSIYNRIPVLDNQVYMNNPWKVNFRQGLFNMTSDSYLFKTRKELLSLGFSLNQNNYFIKEDITYLPLYESKFTGQYNHRGNTFEGVIETEIFGTRPRTNDANLEQLQNRQWCILPRYWVNN